MPTERDDTVAPFAMPVIISMSSSATGGMQGDSGLTDDGERQLCNMS